VTEIAIVLTAEIPLRGHHNVDNVLAATALAASCGIPADAIATAVRNFKAVPHRIEFVAAVNGVAYYNDSIATTPERTLAGVRSFDEPVILLLGGREKHLPLGAMFRDLCGRCRALVFFGEARETLGAVASATRDALADGKGPSIHIVDTLDDAVSVAEATARPGDVVLLSPACTSFDAYDNFEQRGEHFRRLVLALTPDQGGNPP
jgi:UDP-N-acetylmuramoylalanine--D-glutamate ligase